MEGSQFCGNCGTPLPIQTNNPPAIPGYPPVQPGPIILPRRKNHMVVTVIVVVIIVVAMVAAVALIGAGNNGSSNLPVKTGDYILYSVSATASGTTMTGTYNMTFTQVAGTAVTVEYQVALGSNPVQTTYEHFTYDGKSLSSLSGSSSNGTVETSNVLIGQEYINTNYGTKSVQHYHEVYSDGTFDDLYQSSGMGMPLRMVYHTSTMTMTCQIEDTNITWN